jgi:hypothetical protein
MKETTAQIAARNLAARIETKGWIGQEISDMHKELHGFRLRLDWQRMSMDELRVSRNHYARETAVIAREEQADRARTRAKVADAFTRVEWSVGEIA